MINLTNNQVRAFNSIFKFTKNLYPIIFKAEIDAISILCYVETKYRKCLYQIKKSQILCNSYAKTNAELKLKKQYVYKLKKR